MSVEKIVGNTLISILLWMLVFTSSLPIAKTINREINADPISTVDSYSQSANWWHMYHQGPTHKAYSNSYAPSSNATCWIAQLSGSVRSSPAIVNDILYISTTSGNIYALNASDSRPIWNQTVLGNLHNSDRGSPAVANGMVYVSAGNWLHALNANTGERIWNSSMPSEMTSAPCPSTDLSKIYVCSFCHVLAINASTGKQIWNFSSPGVFVGSATHCSPTLRNLYAYDEVYVAANVGDDAIVYRLDGRNGEVLRSRTLDLVVFESLALDGYNVFVPSDNGCVWVLDAYTLNGTALYAGHGAQNAPSIGYGMIYTCTSESVGDHGGWVIALEISTGNVKWEFRTGGDYPFIYGSAAVADGKVFVGAEEDHKIYALNAITGSVLWTYETGASIWVSPAVANNRMYIGSDDGRVYAFAYGLPFVHDSAITKHQKDPLCKNYVCQNYSMHFLVTAENQGDYSGYANVTLCWNTTTISTTRVFLGHLGSILCSVAINFTWNTTGLSRYSAYEIVAYVMPATNETDLSDNSMHAGSLVITFPGDINGDRKVDLRDVFAVQKAYGSVYSTGQYLHSPRCANCPHSPDCDINNDHTIDLKDYYIVCQNYGKPIP